MIRPRRFAGLALVMVVVSCADLQAPEPARRPAVAKVWEAPPSFLVIPVRVSAPPKAWSEGAVPASLKGQGSGQKTLTAWFLKHDWHYWWEYELRRAPLTLGFDGPKIRVGASLTGDLSARWDTLPGDISSEVEADVGVEATLKLGTDWRVSSQTQTFLDVLRADVPIGIAWDGNFFGETISIADPVRKALQPSLETLSKELTGRIEGLQPKPAVEAFWNDVQNVYSGPEGGVWFNLDPQTLTTGALTTSADSLNLGLTITVHPVVTSGPRPESSHRPLPSAVPGLAPPSGFLLNLPLAVEWEEVLDLADLGSGSTPRDMGNGAKIRITAMRPLTDGDRVLLKVNAVLSPPWPGPDVDAILWLTARPFWDEVGRSLRLVDTALEAGTKTYLRSQASWMLADQWIGVLEPELSWHGGPSLDARRAQASALLAHLNLGPHLLFSATLESMEVVDFSLTNQGVEVLARATAHAAVTWVP